MRSQTTEHFRRTGLKRFNRLASIEHMEQRRLLAVDLVVEDGILIVKGDDAANSVQIQTIGDSQIGLEADGVRAILETKEFRAIQIALGDGDDELKIAPEVFIQFDIGEEAKEPLLSIDMGEGENRLAVGEEQKAPTPPDLERISAATQNALSLSELYFGESQQLRDQQTDLLNRLDEARARAEREFFRPAIELAQQITEDGDPRAEEVQKLLESADSIVAEVSVELQATEATQNKLASPLVDQLSELRKRVGLEDAEIDDPIVPKARAAAPSCAEFENGNVLFSIIFIGGSGNDFISISSSVTVNAFLDGNGGNDTIIGGGGHDRIEGGTGTDILVGRDGNDYILGEQDGDSIYGNAGSDCLFGGSDGDWMSGGSGSDIMQGNAGADFLYGNSGNDTMEGNAGDDCVHAGTGDDIAYGNEDRDLVWGGPDNDVLEGNDGIDVVMGEDGNDRMFGGAGQDAMLGGLGTDLMSGGLDADLMLGEADTDYMIGGFGPDDMDGGAGDDVMFGSLGNDAMSGQSGNDFISGGNGLDNIGGGDGDDMITGGNDLDLMDGDADNDHLLGGHARDVIYGSAGNDCLAGGTHDDTLDSGFGNDILHGNGGEDLMYGRDGNDEMTGGSEADIILSGLGNDVLVSGSGSLELLWGLTGDDTYEGTSGTNIIFDPHAADNNLLYEGAGINLRVFPSTINTTTGFYPNYIPLCSTAIPSVSAADFRFDAELFEAFFEGASHQSTIGFDGLSGLIAADHYEASHGVTFDNLGAIGVSNEGDPSSVEQLDGYDGGYRNDGDQVLVSHPNHVNPITLLFEPSVQSVGSFIATGAEGVDHTITIEAFDESDNLILSQTIEVTQYDDGDNFEGFWAMETAENSIAKVTLLNNNTTNFGNAIILDDITLVRDLPGDFNMDGKLTTEDIDELCQAIHDGSGDAIYDVNGDGIVDLEDHDYWVKELKKTWYGDANLDGEFTSADLVEVFTAGKYETGLAASWSEGDWNCDGVFGSGDLVFAFADGGYESGPVPALTTRSYQSPITSDDLQPNENVHESNDGETVVEVTSVELLQGVDLELFATDEIFKDLHQGRNFETNDQEWLG